MTGHVSTAVVGPRDRPDDFTDLRVLGLFEAAAQAGIGEGSRCEFVVTIESDDLSQLVSNLGYPAAIAGTLSVPALHAKPLTVVGGQFRLLVEERVAADTWHMTYHMPLVTTDGQRWTFDGTKVIRCDGRPWGDTTTLYVTVRDERSLVLARGILRIGPADVARLLRTLQVDGVAGAAERVRWLARFGRMLGGQLLPVYGGPLGIRQQFRRNYEQTPQTRATSLPEPTRWWWTHSGGWVEADDSSSDGEVPADAALAVTRYQGGAKGPVLISPGFAMPASSYLLTTTRQNLVEHLVGQQFDAWLVDLRFSPLLPSAQAEGNVDQLAMEDWPRIIDKVLGETGRDDVQVVAHCFTSVALQMGLLASPGMEGKVRSLVASQVTVHPRMSAFNTARTKMRLADRLSSFGFRHIVLDPTPDLDDYALDVALRLNPMLHDERCTSPVCRWAFWWFGPIYRHAQLDEDTHLSMQDLFKSTSMSYMRHISRMVAKGTACDVDGHETYVTDANAKRLRLPILFLAGRENRMFLPETSAETLKWLRRVLSGTPGPSPAQLYTRLELPGYAHLDTMIGRAAYLDVYPKISQHLLATT